MMDYGIESYTVRRISEPHEVSRHEVKVVWSRWHSPDAGDINDLGVQHETILELVPGEPIYEALVLSDNGGLLLLEAAIGLEVERRRGDRSVAST